MLAILGLTYRTKLHNDPTAPCFPLHGVAVLTVGGDVSMEANHPLARISTLCPTLGPDKIFGFRHILTLANTVNPLLPLTRVRILPIQPRPHAMIKHILFVSLSDVHQ